MPETPDFTQIARSMITTIVSDDAQRRQAIDGAVAEIAEQLRLVWNARGAADLAKIDFEFSDQTLTLKSLDRALRSLDR